MRICSLLPSGTEILYSLGLGDQAINPDLIITQELCEVCAVSYKEVQRAVRVLEGQTRIVSLEPNTLGDVLNTISLVGQLTGREEAAQKNILELKGRLTAVRERVRGL